MSEDPISTGLEAAVYVPPENRSVATIVTAAVNPVAVPGTQMPAGWSIHRVAALVRDLAMNMYDLPVILKTHGLSEEQYKLLTPNPLFQRTLEAMTIDWNSPQSTQKRLALEALIAIEDALPTVAARMSKANEPLTGIVALLQLLTKVAGIGENAPQGPVGEKFKITINLGADVFQQEKSSSPKVVDGLQPLTEGLSTNAALQRLVQAP